MVTVVLVIVAVVMIVAVKYMAMEILRVGSIGLHVIMVLFLQISETISFFPSPTGTFRSDSGVSTSLDCIQATILEICI